MTVREKLEKLEMGFVILTLLLSTESFISLMPHAVRQLFWLGVYGVTALLLALRWKTSLEVIGRSKLLWLLIGVVCISIVWSDAPTDTVRQSIALIGTTLFGIYLASRFQVKEQVHLLSVVFGMRPFSV